MTTSRTERQHRGEHLVALLVLALILLTSLWSIPAVLATADKTTTQAEQRVELPLVVAARLDGSP